MAGHDVLTIRFLALAGALRRKQMAAAPPERQSVATLHSVSIFKGKML